jgi:DNA invertase Pin-like site-specific DNA recombinase
MSEHNSTPIRAVAYYRKSDDDDGSSVEDQRTWAVQACRTENIDLAASFVDQAIAGHATPRRDGFKEMLTFCQKQYQQGDPIDAVVCWNENRFSRADSQETAWFVWEFRRVGTNRMFTHRSGWRDFDRMTDRLVFNIEQDATHNAYSRSLAEDSVRGSIRKAKEGWRNGGVTPYAYRAVRTPRPGNQGTVKYDTRLVLGPDDEVETVRWLFDQYATTSRGLRSLAVELTVKGVPSPTGLPLWGVNTVRAIIANPVYLGRNVWNRFRTGSFIAVVDCGSKPRGREKPPQRKSNKEPKGAPRRANDRKQWIYGEDAKHDPIVNVETYDRCQTKRASRQGPGRPGRGTFLLSGLLKCGHCGRTLVGRNASPNSRRKRAYTCCGYDAHGKAACGFRGVHADDVERVILEKLQAEFLNTENLTAIREEVRRQDAAELADRDPASIRRARRKLATIEASIKTATRRLATEENDSLVPLLRADLKGLVIEQQEAADRLKALEATPDIQKVLEAKVDAAMAILSRLQTALGAQDLPCLQQLLREIIAGGEFFWATQPYGTRGPVTCSAVG